MTEYFPIIHMTTEYRMPMFNEVGIKNCLCTLQTSKMGAQTNLQASCCSALPGETQQLHGIGVMRLLPANWWTFCYI